MDREGTSSTPALRWIETTGGPHILVAEHDLSVWKGCEGWLDGEPDDPSDYARACGSSGNWLNLIPSTQNDIVVLGGDFGSVAWVPSSPTHGVLVQWIGCDSDAAVLEMLAQNALKSIERTGDVENITLPVGPSGRLILMDASAHGRQVKPEDIEEILLQPGQYQIRAYYVETETCMAVIREFSRVDLA